VSLSASFGGKKERHDDSVRKKHLVKGGDDSFAVAPWHSAKKGPPKHLARDSIKKRGTAEHVVAVSSKKKTSRKAGSPDWVKEGVSQCSAHRRDFEKREGVSGGEGNCPVMAGGSCENRKREVKSRYLGCLGRG